VVAEAICEIEATGFDLCRMRPARALARWANAKIPVTPPRSDLPPSTIVAWHIDKLTEWGIPTADPRLLDSGRILSSDPLRRIEFGLLKDAAGLVTLVQTVEGVVLGAFTPSLNRGDAAVSDPTLRTAVFVLEHPSGEQRVWRIRDPADAFRLTADVIGFGGAVLITYMGGVCCRARPSMSLTAEDARFMSAGGRFEQRFDWLTRALRWEFWDVRP
jgi:hypothetical protein